MKVFADQLQGPSIDWISLSPILILLAGAMVLLVAGALTRPWPRGWYASLTVAVAAATGVMTVVLWHQVDREGATTLVADAMHVDKVALWTTLVVCVSLVLTALTTDAYLHREQLQGPEVYALYLLAAVGAVVMGAANDLVVLFLGIEILSIALYVLAASHRRRAQSQEAGLKYFVLGSFSSAVLLYGAALLYAGTGSTNFTKIVAAFDNTVQLERAHDAMILAGVALLLVGLGFKVAAAPFHFWAPDVYEGSPTPVSGFMASAAKAGAFAAMLRVLVIALGHRADDYRPVLWAIAVLTLVIGSVMAVVQTNVKRMLAYSSISHAGFMLVGVEAAAHRPGVLGGPGVSGVLVYTLVYAVLVCGTFAVVTAVGRTGDDATDLAGFRGLGRTRPVLAMAMTVLLVAQAGVPLTSGFVAKFAVISAAVDVHSYAIAVIAMLAAVIAAYLYLRIMVSMWAADPQPGDDAREPVKVPATLAISIGLAVAFTLAAGFYPAPLLDITR